MKIRTRVHYIVWCGFLILAGLLLDISFDGGIFFNEVEARIGRPATPGSVAGVSRRTRRRAFRRTAIYVETLPSSCEMVAIDGTTLYLCGSSYYQKDGTQYVLVEVD